MRHAAILAIVAVPTDRHLEDRNRADPTLPVLLGESGPEGTTEDEIRVGVLGATGYVGAELIRLLLDHPRVREVVPGARRSIGASLSAVFPHIACDAPILDADRVLESDTDVLFCAAPTEVALGLGRRMLAGRGLAIDLSGAHRLEAAGFERAYGDLHPDAEAAASFSSGLVEIDADEVGRLRAFAAPGCFATAVLLGVLPLARAGLLSGRVRVAAATGSSGGGATPNAKAHHPVRHSNLSPYRVLAHQHAPEIEAVLAPSFCGPVDFVPISAPLSRGILATCFVELAGGISAADVGAALGQAYDGHLLVQVFAPGGRQPSVGRVAGTMRAEIGWAVDGRTGASPTAVVNVAIDNLVRGGGGHGVQAMNAMMGWPRDTGLTRTAAWP